MAPKAPFQSINFLDPPTSPYIPITLYGIRWTVVLYTPGLYSIRDNGFYAIFQGQYLHYEILITY